jgi:hypothetical protein
MPEMMPLATTVNESFVWNFEFGSLEFIWNLIFGACNFYLGGSYADIN